MARGERRHTPPTRLTSFVGRQGQLAEVERLLRVARLVTLVGAPGLGKTRLALELGARLAAEYADGVGFVELAPLADPDLVPQTVSAALGLAEQSGRPLVETLSDYLGPVRLLLILDNCEHLVAACAELADCLLRAAPGLRILATSREPLGIAGEHTWRVPALALPASEQPPDVAELERCEAVRLFVERAVEAANEFELTARNAPAVARICRQLDGIPLAIELAAARTRVLTPEQIAARLDDRFRLLTGGSRLALPRQQTLGGAIDWSHEHLVESEQILWRRLSVFAGGWSLEAAEAICAGDGLDAASVLDLLTRLVDRSLVLVEQREAEARYRFLETIRQYGAEKLHAADEETGLRDRHRDWFLALAEAAEPGVRGPDQERWLSLLEREHDNLRAALRWSHARAAEPDLELRLAGALWWFWFVRGYWTEGHAWLEAVLTRPGPASVTRVRALNAAALLAQGHGQTERHRALCAQSLAMARGLGDERGEMMSRWVFSLGTKEHAKYAAAGVSVELGLVLARRLEEPWFIANLLDELGHISMGRGDLACASAVHAECLAIARETGDTRHQAIALESLGRLAWAAGDQQRAVVLLGDSLALLRRVGDRRRLAIALSFLLSALAQFDEVSHFVPLIGAIDTLWQSIGIQMPPYLRANYERAVTAALGVMSRTAFEAARTSGCTMTLDEILALARAAVEAHQSRLASPRAPGEEDLGLSPREREVVALVADGLTNRQIAEVLVIAERTAGTHVAHVLNKLGFSSRAQIAAWAVEHGLRRAT
jgi:non-specific serine/threonine protein kinase